MSQASTEILVLYYSPGGSTRELAQIIARGVEQTSGCAARVRTVAPIIDHQVDSSNIPESGDLYASSRDLAECDGLLLGCPTHFGNMPAAMKHFIDSSSDVWMSGKLVGKPAAVFSASTSLHGGQESTLLTMLLPLLHHGMIIAGLPYTEAELFSTTSGGSPYGATRLTDDLEDKPMTEEEHKLGLALGKRIADIASRLKQN